MKGMRFPATYLQQGTTPLFDVDRLFSRRPEEFRRRPFVLNSWADKESLEYRRLKGGGNND